MPFPVTDAAIAEAETALGVRFPESFRVAMKADNGGGVVDEGSWGHQWRLNPFLDRSSRKRLARTINHVVRETEVARTWPGFPPDAVAIGDNGCGDLLVFMPETEGRLAPTVYVWDHASRTLTEVAADFSALPRLP